MAFFQSVVSLHMSVLTGIHGTSCYEEHTKLAEISPDIDRGWAFVVVIASFIGHILVYGPSWSFGILYITFLEEFEELPSVTAWIGTISAAFSLLGGPVGSLVINRYGNRVAVVIGCLLSTAGLAISSWADGVVYLYISFGVTAGIGWSIAYIPLVNVLGDYFHRYRKLSIGCASAGVGMGLFVYPPLLTALIHQYHWRGTMLIIAAINLNFLVTAAVSMPPRLSPRQYMEQQVLLEEKQMQSAVNDARMTSSVMSLDGNETRISRICRSAYLKKLFQYDVFQSPHFILMALNNVFYAFSASIVFTHLSNFAKSYHYHETFCSALISAIGAMNTFGRVSLGLIIQHPRVNVIGTYVIFFSISGIATLTASFFHTHTAFLTFALIFGFASAAFGTVTPEVIIYICGLRRLASGYGYILVFEAIGMVLGGPAGGWVLEAFHEYHGCFIMAGVTAIISGLLMVPSWYLLARYRGLADAGPRDTEGGGEF